MWKSYKPQEIASTEVELVRAGARKFYHRYDFLSTQFDTAANIRTI